MFLKAEHLLLHSDARYTHSSTVTSGCEDIGQVIKDHEGKSTSTEVLDYCIDLARKAIMKENISP